MTVFIVHNPENKASRDFVANTMGIDAVVLDYREVRDYLPIQGCPAVLIVEGDLLGGTILWQQQVNVNIDDVRTAIEQLTG